MNRPTLARYGHRAADGHIFGCTDCHAHGGGLTHCHEAGGELHGHTQEERSAPHELSREPKVEERKLGDVKPGEVKPDAR